VDDETGIDYYSYQVSEQAQGEGEGIAEVCMEDRRALRPGCLHSTGLLLRAGGVPDKVSAGPLSVWTAAPMNSDRPHVQVFQFVGQQAGDPGYVGTPLTNKTRVRSAGACLLQLDSLARPALLAPAALRFLVLKRKKEYAMGVG